MPPFYNHGHADALSITLTKEGRQVLVDPGTYRYNGVPEWRRYFKGTRAHNTVTIDGLDQAVQETGFIWSKPYNAELLCISEQNDAFLVKAVHDGYSRLRKKVWHQRSVLFFDKTSFLLKDSFSGEGIHKFELNYHLHPDAVLTKSHDWWLIDNHGSKVFVRLLHEGDFFFVRAQEDPPLGWYSPSYGIKTKSGFLSCIKTGTPGQTSFVTAMCTQAPLNKDKLEKRASNI
ncbi:MAG: heparinase II/III-family protein [Thermodesulfobacteriota bacterium]|nr:heparinase II/III-family protein [Thermodesulfobacteriota bacterium]